MIDLDSSIATSRGCFPNLVWTNKYYKECIIIRKHVGVMRWCILSLPSLPFYLSTDFPSTDELQLPDQPFQETAYELQTNHPRKLPSS